MKVLKNDYPKIHPNITIAVVNKNEITPQLVHITDSLQGNLESLKNIEHN